MPWYTYNNPLVKHEKRLPGRKRYMMSEVTPPPMPKQNHAMYNAKAIAKNKIYNIESGT